MSDILIYHIDQLDDRVIHGKIAEIKENIRELTGALNRIVSYSRIYKN